MSRPIRVVAFRRTSAVVGGPENLLVSQARYTDRNAVDLTVIDFGPTAESRSPLLQQIAAHGIATATIPARSKFDILRSVRYVADLLSEHRADVLHTHDHRTDFIGYFAARRSRIPIVVSVWQPLRRYWWLWHVEVLDDHLIRRFDRLLPCSQAVRAEILAKRPDLAPRTVLIPGGVDLAGFRVARASRAEIRSELGIADGAFVCVFAGRIMEDKGLPYLVEAQRLLRDAGLDLVQVMVGDGPQRVWLQERIRDVGLADRFRFIGYRQDLPAVLEACDLLVHPSLSEGLSISIITAMAAGLAIVATKVGGTAESVVDGECGLLVEPRDAAGLARCVQELVADPLRRKRLGDRARELAFERWSVERMVRDFERVYREVVQSREAAPAGRLRQLPDAVGGR
jgi:glycosyltransferase involved in cell wall biosynthesis